jgi:hypothetical protein
MIIITFKISGQYIIFFGEGNVAIIAISPEDYHDAYNGLYRYDPGQTKILGVDLI